MGGGCYKSFEIKLVKRLLLPYYLAELLWYPIWFIVCHKAGYLTYSWDWDKIEPLDAFAAIFIGNNDGFGLILAPLWFLPALLFTEIIFVALYNRLKKIDWKIFLAAIFFASIGFNVVLPMGIDIAFVSQIFILAGILIRKNNFVDKISLTSCVVLMLMVVFAFWFNEHVNMTFRRYGDPILFYMGGLAGTVLLMKISTLMTRGKIFSLISSCGRQSMMILILHPIIANVLYEIIARATNFEPEDFFKEPLIILAVTMTGTLIPLFIARRFGKLPVLRVFCT